MNKAGNIVSFIAVILVGMMAGLMFGTGMDQYTHRLLSATAWTTEHQVMDALFRVVLPPLWNITMLSLAAAAVLSKGSTRWLFGVAAAIFFVSLIITIRIEVPMNRAIEHWDVNAVPAQWAEVRDRWLTFHLARTLGGFVAFLCAVTGLMKRKSSDQTVV